MGMLKEFKEFTMRGNVVDMAVGVIIGGAFGKIVSSLVNDVIMPPIGVLVGGMDFTSLKLTIKQAVMENGEVVTPAVTLNYGNFIQVTVDFLIIAAAIFMLIKAINVVNRKKEAEKAAVPAPPPAPAEPSEDIKLLTEIRDLLKK